MPVKAIPIEFRKEHKFRIEVSTIRSVFNRRANRHLRRERLDTNRSSVREQFRTTQN